MYFLGHSGKSMDSQCCHSKETNVYGKVVYQAGVNEKLLGDFIRKHNVRDKIFSE
jgi:hypothetical protein